MSYRDQTTKKARVDYIRDKLAKDDAWLYSGLVAIYNEQDDDEQNSSVTIRENGRGFNATDAAFLTSLAQQFLNRGTLSPRQLTSARRAMQKYAAQLERIAERKTQEYDKD